MINGNKLKIGSLIKNNNPLNSIWKQLDWDSNSSKYIMMDLYYSSEIPVFAIFIEFVDNKYDLIKIFYNNSTYYSFVNHWDLIDDI